MECVLVDARLSSAADLPGFKEAAASASSKSRTLGDRLASDSLITNWLVQSASKASERPLFWGYLSLICLVCRPMAGA